MADRDRACSPRRGQPLRSGRLRRGSWLYFLFDAPKTANESLLPCRNSANRLCKETDARRDCSQDKVEPGRVICISSRLQSAAQIAKMISRLSGGAFADAPLDGTPHQL